MLITKCIFFLAQQPFSHLNKPKKLAFEPKRKVVYKSSIHFSKLFVYPYFELETASIYLNKLNK